MSTDSEALDRIRRDIDRIDDRIHDLLMERTELVGKVAQVKASTDAVALRPGREADILRRLIGRHQGPFPVPALVRIWRELMGALVGLQKPFTIAVCQTERGAGYIELARDHFGTVWPKIIHPSPGHVVRDVADGAASVGVVPIPSASDTDPWWLSLTADSANLPKVVARLPMLPTDPAPAGREPLEGFIIACRDHDVTGDDHTLIAVETAPDISRDRLRALFAAAGLETASVITTHRQDDVWLHLTEVGVHVAADDSRLAALLGDSKDPVRLARVIGGYPGQLTV